MGTYYHAIVDTEASVDEAEQLGTRIRDWLTRQEIVEPKPNAECVLNGWGYPPGPQFTRAIRIGERRKPNVPEEYETTRSLRTNGLQLMVGRNCFMGGQGGFFNVTCSSCGATSDSKALTGFWEALDRWLKGNETSSIICPNCGYQRLLPEWAYEPTWGFGNLGLRFWNWPALKETFIQDIAEQLGNHRVVQVYGKL